AGHRGTGVDRLTRGDRGASERQLPSEPLPERPWGRPGAARARAQERGLRGAARSARRDDARGWPEGRRRHLSAALRRGSRPVLRGRNAAAAAGARRRGERRAPDPPRVRARWARDTAGRRIPLRGRPAHGLLPLEWRVPVPFLSLGVGPYARTPRTLTVAPYVALGWAAAPVTGTPWVATPGTRITLGLAFE